MNAKQAFDFAVAAYADLLSVPLYLDVVVDVEPVDVDDAEAWIFDSVDGGSGLPLDLVAHLILSNCPVQSGDLSGFWRTPEYTVFRETAAAMLMSALDGKRLAA